MSTATTELNLQVAVGADDTADYLTNKLGGSLQVLDGLFSQPSGHTHSGPHQGGSIRANAFVGPMDIPDWFRSTGQTTGFPSSGIGLEMYWSGVAGVLQSYDRGANAYRDLMIESDNTKLAIGGATVLEIDASGNLNFYRTGTKTGSLRPRAGALGFEFVNAAYTTVTLGIDDSGNVTVPGALTVTGGASTGPLGVNGNLHVTGTTAMDASITLPANGSGVTWTDANTRIFSQGRTTYYDEYNGGWVWRNSAASLATCLHLDGAGNLTVLAGVSATQLTGTNGNLYLNTRRLYDGGDGLHTDWDFRIDNAHDIFTHSIHLNASVGGQINTVSGQLDLFGPNGSTNLRVFHNDTSWMGVQAASFNQQSSAASKTDISLMADRALALICEPTLRGVSYTRRSDNSRAVGFVADAWLDFLPEAVSLGQDGEPEAMDYAQVTAVLWEVVRRLVAQTGLCR